MILNSTTLTLIRFMQKKKNNYKNMKNLTQKIFCIYQLDSLDNSFGNSLLIQIKDKQKKKI
jgi:hypothetical protein